MSGAAQVPAWFDKTIIDFIFWRENYVDNHGQYFASQALSNAEREIVSKAAEPCEFEPSCCFLNALQLVAQDPTSLTYVEGYVLRAGCPAVQHAWVAINGKVIDPTRSRDGAGIRAAEWGVADCLLGVLPVGVTYLGVSFPVEEARKAINEWGSVLDALRAQSTVRPAPAGKALGV